MNYSSLIARFHVLGLPSNFSIVTKQFENCYQTIPKLFANGLLPASPQVYHERLAVAALDGLAVAVNEYHVAVFQSYAQQLAVRGAEYQFVHVAEIALANDDGSESLHARATIDFLREIGKAPSRIQGDTRHVSLSHFLAHAVDYHAGLVVLGNLEPLEDADADSVSRLAHQLAVLVQLRVEIFVDDIRVSTAQAVLNHHAALFRHYRGTLQAHLNLNELENDLSYQQQQLAREVNA